MKHDTLSRRMLYCGRRGTEVCETSLGDVSGQTNTGRNSKKHGIVSKSRRHRIRVGDFTLSNSDAVGSGQPSAEVCYGWMKDYPAIGAKHTARAVSRVSHYWWHNRLFFILDTFITNSQRVLYFGLESLIILVITSPGIRNRSFLSGQCNVPIVRVTFLTLVLTSGAAPQITFSTNTMYQKSRCPG